MQNVAVVIAESSQWYEFKPGLLIYSAQNEWNDLDDSLISRLGFFFQRKLVSMLDKPVFMFLQCASNTVLRNGYQCLLHITKIADHRWMDDLWLYGLFNSISHNLTMDSDLYQRLYAMVYVRKILASNRARTQPARSVGQSLTHCTTGLLGDDEC